MESMLLNIKMKYIVAFICIQFLVGCYFKIKMGGQMSILYI